MKKDILVLSQLGKLFAILLFFFSFDNSLNAQYDMCGRDSWAWPGHNHWFWPIARPLDATNYVLDQRAGSLKSITNPASPAAWDMGNIVAYQGVATASRDDGSLLFFANGRSAFRADGTVITNGLLAGNECGSQVGVTSAVHGTMIVRHPLQPSLYYIITIDDVVNQGCPNAGISYAVIDSSANLIHNSIPIETNITSNLQGKLRTTEGFGATFHGNGVDIWLTFHPLGKTKAVSYLLTCEGFVTPPVVSGTVPNLKIAEGVGDVSFSPDGSKVAVGCESYAPDCHSSLSLYDFDNWTGTYSNRKQIYPAQWSSQNFYNVIFSSDGNALHYSGNGKAGMLDISSDNTTTIRAQGFVTSPFLSQGFEAASVNYTGTIEQYDKTKYPETASAGGAVFSSNNMYIPPQEEPDITPVGPFCDTASVVDLATVWRCAGVNAELAIKPDLGSPTDNDAFGYFGNGIATDDSSRIKGLFDPVAAGVGTHMIEFRFCGVDDTIWIDVVKCPACKAKLEDITPKFCAGNEIRLDTFIIAATGTRTWTIDSMPSASPNAALSFGGGDTLFNAMDNGIKYGTYKLKLEGTFGVGETCYDTMYVTVDSLPLPDLGNDTSICADWNAVTFDAGPYVDFLWGPDGETTQTITKSVSNTYTVSVTDANGCQGDDDVVLTINDLPIAVLPNDTSICDGDPAIDFSAASSTGGSGSAVSSFTWNDGALGDTKTTDVDGLYWVAIEDANMCRDTDTVVLTVNALPTVDLRSDTSICFGDAPITFEALNPDANDSIYVWNTGETGPSIAKDTAGTFRVVLTDKNGCLDSTEVTLTINLLPTIALRDSVICGDAPNVVWNAETAAPGMILYQWVELPANTPTGVGAVLDTKTAGDYAIGIVDANQCVAADTITLTVNNFVPVDLGPDTAICADADPVVLDAGIDNCNWYLWTPDNGTPTDQKTYSVNTQGLYRVQLEDENGCQGEDSIIVTVNALPVVDLGPDSTICFGDPAVVFDAGNAGVGMLYTWGPGAETAQTISVTDAGEYTVAIQDVNGCTDTDSVVLAVNALPTPDLGPNQEICQAEDSVTFDAGYPTALSWVWDHGPTTQAIKAHFDPAATGSSTETYTVTVTDANGCVKDTFATLTINPMPSVAIRDSSVCQDAPDVVFDVGATFASYAWSNGGSAQTESHSAAGTYTVTFTTAAGCAGTDEFELIRTALPTPDLGLDQTICADAAAVTFDAGAYASYVWSPNGETSQTITTDVAGTYEVEVTDVNNCKATTEVELIVIPMPTPDVIDDYTKCPGANHTFDVATYDDGFGPFTYAWHDGTTTTADYSTTAAGAVWVDITNAHGCTARDEGSVVDNPSLIVDITATPDIHLCDGELATLVPNFKAANGYFFTWTSGGVTATSETIAVSTAGVYDLHVDNGGGCEGDGSIEIFVHPYPVLVPSVAGICDGDPAVIGGDNDLGGTFTYAWSTGETTPTISVTTAGTYTQTVTSDRGCVSTETVNVDVYPNPVPDLGTPVEVCEGVPVTLSNTGPGTGLTYSWSTGSTDPTINPTTNGTYSLTVTTPQNCSGSDDVLVTFIPIPVVEIGPDITLCEGESASVYAGNEDLTVTWNSGQNTSDITVNQTFEHIVTVDNGLCNTKDTMNVYVVPMPVSEIDQSLGDESYCFEDMTRGIEIIAGTNPAYSYQWNTVDADTTPEITVTGPGTYLVNISAGNCVIQDNIVINEFCPSFFFAPNAFTPDGDGQNEIFSPKGHNLTDYTLVVYNRWGQLIFESNNIDTGWDGTFMGNECQIDVYVWKAFYSVNHPDGKPRKEQAVGRVSLLR